MLCPQRHLSIILSRTFLAFFLLFIVSNPGDFLTSKLKYGIVILTAICVHAHNLKKKNLCMRRGLCIHIRCVLLLIAVIGMEQYGYNNINYLLVFYILNYHDNYTSIKMMMIPSAFSRHKQRSRASSTNSPHQQNPPN